MLSVIAQKNMLANLYNEEGYRQFAYDDADGQTVKAPKGNLTIGIGWNIQTNGCPRPIAEFAVMYFIQQCDVALNKDIAFYNALDDVRKAVLCDMSFNMGEAKILDFEHMLAAMEKQDWKTAAICMLQSVWAKQVGQRATNLSRMMETGKWI